MEYTFAERSGLWIVIHEETGYEMPYNNGKVDAEWISFATRETLLAFSSWTVYSRRKRKHLKTMCCEGKKAPICISDGCATNSLADCVPCKTVPVKPLKCVPQAYIKSMPSICQGEKEEVMNTVDYSATQRRHLTERAYTVRFEKENELSKHFGLTDTPQPKTVKEFIEFIKTDKFTVGDEKNMDRKLRWSAWDAAEWIRFRDPDIKEDQDGFDAAMELVNKDYKALKDDILILEPKEGLEKLRAFEEKTFH